MIIHSKAPFRLGLAGGGTDVSPYSDIFGGAVLNATVNLYAHAEIIPRNDNQIVLSAAGKMQEIHPANHQLVINGHLDLQKGIYNRIVKDFSKKPLSFELITRMDVPSGSGLGTSSTLVVAILGAFVKWLELPLSNHEIAQLAFKIEREDLRMAGGKQDQYAATFGGVNMIEFNKEKVTVHPIKLAEQVVKRLQDNILLFYTKTNRKSANIIEIQAKNVIQEAPKPINAMHFLKKQAYAMQAALQQGELKTIGTILDQTWQHKKLMADGITNSLIDQLYETAIQAGAIGGKISGAGGGGFMIFYVNPDKMTNVQNALNQFEGNFKSFKFTDQGLLTWTSNESS